MKQTYMDYDDIPVAFNPETLGQIIGVSRSTAYQLAKAPDFPKIKAGKRIIIEKYSFLAWLKAKVGSETVQPAPL